MIRSVSDAVEPSNKYCSAQRRCNGLLRRPEVLETVYSVEEDADGEPITRSDNDPDDAADEEDHSDEGKCRQQQATSSGGSEGKPRLRDLYGSFERLTQHEDARQDRTTDAGAMNVAQTTPSLQRTRDESQQAQVRSGSSFF